MCEGFDLKPYYLWPFNTFQSGKTPTKKEIEELANNLSRGLEFDRSKLSFNYSYFWSTAYNAATTGISYKDFTEMKPPYFLSKDQAAEYSNQVKDQRRKDKEFDELHKKDLNYKYEANGYKFLGWQNSWRETPIEYSKCREQNHRTIHVSRDNRGTEHIVSCPVCMIMSKYDSSD